MAPVPEALLESFRARQILCPKCNPPSTCDHVIGELIFPNFKETWGRSFLTCWKHEMVRAVKPFGWERENPGKVFVVRWWIAREAMVSMLRERVLAAGELKLDLSESSVQKIREQRAQKIRKRYIP